MKNGTFYRGLFANDYFNGFGTKCINNIFVRITNGYGTFTYAPGNPYTRVKYVGEWKKDVKSGFGTLLWKDGEQYRGHFENDLRDGVGKASFSVNDTRLYYEGEWKEDKMTGNGTLKWKDGDSYVGDFEDSKLSGAGTYTWSSGAEYVGNFKNDQRNGYGLLTFSSGMKAIPRTVQCLK